VIGVEEAMSDSNSYHDTEGNSAYPNPSPPVAAGISPGMWSNESRHRLLHLLSDLCSKRAKGERASIERGDVVLTCASASILELAIEFKNRPDFDFSVLLSVTAIDWMDDRDHRFEMVYHFLSISHLHRLRLKCSLTEDSPSIASLTPLWKSAFFLERECFDMYGVTFSGHPDLRRILMYEEFKGHPLRKDYPVQGKQPRITLRAPEVRNTAVDMTRPPLVALKRRKNKDPLTTELLLPGTHR
jgi:NADH-quinone oxidoreductase subunit C